jgi:hypothetical protein
VFFVQSYSCPLSTNQQKIEKKKRKKNFDENRKRNQVEKEISVIR